MNRDDITPRHNQISTLRAPDYPCLIEMEVTGTNLQNLK